MFALKAILILILIRYYCRLAHMDVMQFHQAYAQESYYAVSGIAEMFAAERACQEVHGAFGASTETYFTHESIVDGFHRRRGCQAQVCMHMRVRPPTRRYLGAHHTPSPPPSQTQD